MLSWIQQNPAIAASLFTFLWVGIPSLASLGMTRLDKTSVGHAFLTLLAGAGFDLPKFLDGLRRLSASLLGISLTVTILLFALTIPPAPRHVIAVGQGCDWFNKSEPAIVHDVTTDGQCVLTQILAGDVNPAAIGANCGGLAVAQVEAIADSLFEYYVLGNTDAGLAALTPPYKGAPPALDEAGKAKLVSFVQALKAAHRR